MTILLSELFTWNIDPVVFTLPAIPLPYSFSLIGFLGAALLFYYGAQLLKKNKAKQLKNTKPEDIELEWWKAWGLALGSLFLAQLILGSAGPSFESIGPIQPRWYGIMFTSAFVFGYMFGYKTFKDAGRSQEELDSLLTWVLVATVIGARLGHVIFYDWEYYSQNLGQIPAIWNGGLASHGAAIGIIAAMYFFAKRRKDMTFWWLADRVVLGVAIGGFFIRMGNFFNSEIYGHPADVPWAVVFSKIDLLPRHPTMLYEALLCLFVLGILWTIYKKYKAFPPEGSLFAGFLVLLFGGRFFLEYTKVNQAEFAADWTLNMGQWLSVPLVLFGLYLIFFKIDWKQQNKKNQG